MRISVRIQGELGADHPWTQFHPKPCFTFSVKPWPSEILASHRRVLSNYNNPSKPLHKHRFTLQTANKLPYNMLLTQSIYVNPNNKMYVKIEGKYIFLFLFFFKTSSYCAHQTRYLVRITEYTAFYYITCEGNEQKNFVCETRHASSIRQRNFSHKSNQNEYFTARLPRRSSTQHPLKETVHS
jgi:hypothetical protein